MFRLPMMDKYITVYKLLLQIIGGILFSGLYVVIVLSLQFIQLRTNYFDHGGWIYPLHHFLMLLLGGYIAWIFFIVGESTARLMIGNLFFTSMKSLDRIILCGFIGISLIQLSMMLLGYMGLIYKEFILSLTALLLLFSWPRLSANWQFSFFKIRTRTVTDWVYYILVLYLGILLFYLFLFKVIYPTFDWDAVMHYNQYFAEVIRNHHLYPNTVWYHYFYSKGAGAFIFGLLLGGEDAHKLITYISLMYGCLALWSLFLIGRSKILALALVIAYLGVFVTNEWYIFDKQHVMMSCMMLGLLWVSVHYVFADSSIKLFLVYVSALMLIAIIAFVPTTAGIFLPCYMLAMMGCWYFHRKLEMRHCRILCFAVIVTLSALLILNYFTSGMFEINPVRPFFQWANQKRMHQWISPYVVVWLLEGFPKELTSFSFSFHLHELKQWTIGLFHLKEFKWLNSTIQYFLIIFGILYLTRSNSFPKKNRKKHYWLMGIILLIISISSITSLIMNQPISIARFFIFTTPLLLLILSSIFVVATELTVYPQKRKYCYLAFSLFLIFNAIYAVREVHVWRKEVLLFALGKLTYQAAYEAKGLFSMNALNARLYAGLEERMISSNPMQQGYAIPGRPMEVELNYAYKNWDTMVYADALRARKAYEEEGIHYFYFDFNYPINGMIPFSPLFQAKGVLSHLRIVWHHQNAYLLTWQPLLLKEKPILQTHTFLKNAYIENKFIEKLNNFKNTNISTQILYEKVRAYKINNKEKRESIDA